MNEVFITSAVRTAVGSFNGSLANMPAHDLGKIVIKEAIARSNVEASEVEEVILGQVLTAATGQNPARQAAINAGLNKNEVKEKYGEEQFLKWRRGYNTPPPALNTDSEMNPKLDPLYKGCLLYTSPSPRDNGRSRMPSSA